MKAFASIFSRRAGCHNCEAVFKLKKRRQCTICSNIYKENLFCDKCSIKLNHKSLGFLAPKRYCLVCYASIAVSELDGSTSAVLPQQPLSPALNHTDKSKSVEVSRVFIDSDEEQEESPQTTTLPSKEMVYPI